MSDIFKLSGSVEIDNDKALAGLRDIDSEGSNTANKINGHFSNSGSKISGIFSKIGMAMAGAFAVDKIKQAGKWFLDTASNAQEMQNKFDVVFSTTGASMEAWADNLGDKIGRGNTEIKAAVSNQADLMMGMGMSEETAGGLAQKYTELAYDLASFNNVSDDQAIDAMTKAMMGETESAKALGINLSETTMKNSDYVKSLGKNWEELTQAEKAEAYYQEALKQSPNALGDAERSADSYASKMKDLQGKVTEFGEKVGEKLLPVATWVVDKISNIISKATEMVDVVWNYVSPFIDNIVNAFKGGGDKVGGVMDNIKTFFQICWDYIKTVWDSVGQPIFDLIKWAVEFLWGQFQKYFPQIQQIFSDVLNIMRSAWEGIGKPVFDIIKSVICNIVVPAVKNAFRLIGGAFEGIFTTIKGVWNNGIKPIFTGIIDFVSGVFAGDWGRAWDGIVGIVSGIFGGIVEVVKAPINAVIGLINGAIDGINSISVDIPKGVPLVGGKHIGFNIGHIGYLEEGGILTEPTFITNGIMAGEKNKGSMGQPEAVIPLTRMFQEVQSMALNTANTVANGSINVLIEIRDLLRDKELGHNTHIEIKDNVLDAQETRVSLGQLKFNSNF